MDTDGQNTWGEKQPCWGFAVFGFIKRYEAMCREEGATQTGSLEVCDVMEAGQDDRGYL